MSKETIINKHLNKVVKATGHATNDTDSVEIIRDLLEACIDDMVGAGVSLDVLDKSALTYTTFILFINDNMVMSGGVAKMSETYIMNVNKMRCQNAGE